MVGRSILFLTLVATICQESFAQSDVTNKQVVRSPVLFDIDVDGFKRPYQIDFILLNYYIPRLTITRHEDTHSADIRLPGVLLEVGHGDLISEERVYTPYTFVRSQSLSVDITGTAGLVHGGPYLKDCQFSFTQVSPIKDEVPDVVKQILFEKLNELIGERLCRTINETI